MQPNNPLLYEKIKKNVYETNPVHSAYRSMMISKIYKGMGGTWSGKEEGKTKIWLKQNWLSVNDYYRGKEVKCGASDTMKKYNEYPLCRPKALIEKLNKDQMKKLIEAKKDKNPVQAEKVLNTKKYNIKYTKTGI